MNTVGITGSEGLIGSALQSALRAKGVTVRRFDLCLPPGSEGQGNVLDREAVSRMVASCDGVVHLAAVSRVVLGERDPGLCWATNVLGTQTVLDACLAAEHRPWLLFASSREVYGQADRLPVAEDTPLRPVNIYGRSKVEAEKRVLAARGAGLRNAILRFSNVYGSTHDHVDRVVPAFARAAALGQPLRIDGCDHLFDFTHLLDTIAGIVATIERLAAGRTLPPLHLLTGHGTTLGELALLALRAGDSRSACSEAPPRRYDVARFVGDPTRARSLLGFAAQITIADGMSRLVQSFHSLRTDAAAAASGGVQ
jgi:nucleoside-diphosphate-sugar epimerase